MRKTNATTTIIMSGRTGVEETVRGRGACVWGGGGGNPVRCVGGLEVACTAGTRPAATAELGMHGEVM